MHNLGRTVVLIDTLLWFQHTTLLFWCVWRSTTPPNSSWNVQKHGHVIHIHCVSYVKKHFNYTRRCYVMEWCTKYNAYTYISFVQNNSAPKDLSHRECYL